MSVTRWTHNIYNKLAGIINNRRSPRELAELAPDVYRMAQTGEGTDACLKLGCLPMLVHFYSPVPDISDLMKRGVFEQRNRLTGIDFRTEQQLQLLMQLGQAFGEECDWPLKRTTDPSQFFLDNGGFSYGCAAALHCFIRHFKPRRIIEIGSGNSSLVISAALKRNVSENSDYMAEYTIIDPYPGPVTSNGQLYGLSELVKERVELTDIIRFDALAQNDLLFIDSGHTVRIGSDVNYLILDVLPRLQPGVIVHFHDINLPYAPPKVYYTNPAFRVFWTEEYLLQAFLCGNNNFEILLAMCFLQNEFMDNFCKAFPRFDLATNWANSGSFWIRAKGRI